MQAGVSGRFMESYAARLQVPWRRLVEQPNLSFPMIIRLPPQLAHFRSPDRRKLARWVALRSWRTAPALIPA